jgi:holliday junction DNA helicase RuvA
MIEFIQGKLENASPTKAIIDVHGVGYRINIPTTLFAKLPKKGDDVKLYTSFIMREPSHYLYGFTTAQERDLFDVLIGISGIGPKTGIALISSLPKDKLISAIISNDIKSISKAPGIGKKTAERLVLEIKDKLPEMFPLKGLNLRDIDISKVELSVVQDAISALINLGYASSAAEKAVSKAVSQTEKEPNLPVLISLSLRNV